MRQINTTIAFHLLLLISCNTTIQGQSFAEKIAEAAIELTNDKVIYDPSYFSIAYPNGDVPADRGVCTDVVIRTFRAVDIDLQNLCMKICFTISINTPRTGD